MRLERLLLGSLYGCLARYYCTDLRGCSKRQRKNSTKTVHRKTRMRNSKLVHELTWTVLCNDAINEFRLDGVHDEVGCSRDEVAIT